MKIKILLIAFILMLSVIYLLNNISGDNTLNENIRIYIDGSLSRDTNIPCIIDVNKKGLLTVVEKDTIRPFNENLDNCISRSISKRSRRRINNLIAEITKSNLNKDISENIIEWPIYINAKIGTEYYYSLYSHYSDSKDNDALQILAHQLVSLSPIKLSNEYVYYAKRKQNSTFWKIIDKALIYLIKLGYEF